jgi:hypothetical protein
MDQPICQECRAIAHDIRNAYLETWLTAGPEFRDAWLAASKLMGGTEDDVLRAEELFPKAQLKGSPKIADALRRKFVHEAVSGHKVPKPSAGNQ